MDTQPQEGYLVLADISGFTSYLAQVELDHANAVLTELLDGIVARFKTLLAISKLEGDAVFAYLPAPRLARGETLLELIESTYAAFRDQVTAATRRTTCECRACLAIPGLDLKFFVHFGDYMLQNISGIHELVGSDVNLIHRLTKNHITEQTGWKAYVLFTETALTRLGLDLEGLHARVETYDHLGDVNTFSLDLRLRYEAVVAARREIVTPEEADLTTVHLYSVPPPVLWEWLNDPYKRSLYTFDPATFTAVFKPGGRTGVGARTHCVHGKKVAMVETILDWRPFEYYTVQQIIPPFTIRATFRLTPEPNGGTRLQVTELGRATSLRFVDHWILVYMMTRVYPSAKLLDNLERCIKEVGSG